MASTKYPTPTPDLIASDLLIEIRPRGYTDWSGTSAQLREEGLIPEGFKWPHGKDSSTWTSGEFEYSVARCRPLGMKGPMQLWIQGDYWWLRRVLVADYGTGFAAADIHEKRCALEDEVFKHSRAGRALSNLIYKRYREACCDDKYQQFKSMLGLPITP